MLTFQTQKNENVLVYTVANENMKRKILTLFLCYFIDKKINLKDRKAEFFPIGLLPRPLVRLISEYVIKPDYIEDLKKRILNVVPDSTMNDKFSENFTSSFEAKTGIAYEEFSEYILYKQISSKLKFTIDQKFSFGYQNAECRLLTGVPILNECAIDSIDDTSNTEEGSLLIKFYVPCLLPKELKGNTSLKIFGCQGDLLHSSALELLKTCPNLEEIIFTPEQILSEDSEGKLKSYQICQSQKYVLSSVKEVEELFNVMPKLNSLSLPLYWSREFLNLKNSLDFLKIEEKRVGIKNKRDHDNNFELSKILEFTRKK